MSKKQDHLYDLEEDLDDWLPRNGETGRILEAAAAAVAELEVEIQEVQSGLTLQEADTKAEIAEIAFPAQITSDDNESVTEFRKRALKNFQTLTSQGDPEDILKLSASLLNVEETKVRLVELDGEPKFKLEAPLQSIQAEFGTTQDVIDILIDATAASYGLEVLGVGSLEYISETEWENGNYDPAYGYATVDSNGDITDGGTYSGFYVK